MLVVVFVVSRAGRNGDIKGGDIRSHSALIYVLLCSKRASSVDHVTINLFPFLPYTHTHKYTLRPSGGTAGYMGSFGPLRVRE